MTDELHGRACTVKFSKGESLSTSDTGRAIGSDIGMKQPPGVGRMIYLVVYAVAILLPYCSTCSAERLSETRLSDGTTEGWNRFG